MRRTVMLTLLLLAPFFACDDPGVRSKVGEILDHGSVAARAVCPAKSFNSACQGTIHFRATANVLVDGSSHVEFSSTWPAVTASQFNDRGSPRRANWHSTGSDVLYAEFSGGMLRYGTVGTVCSVVSSVFLTQNIVTECHGFNLELFS